MIYELFSPNELQKHVGFNSSHPIADSVRWWGGERVSKIESEHIPPPIFSQFLLSNVLNNVELWTWN